MKEELQGKLVEILTSIQTATGKASDFALEQLPDIAQSYVAYGRAWLLIQFVLLVVATVAFVLIGIRVDRKMDKYDRGVIWIPMGPLALITGIGSVVALKSAALVWFAPKVWLLKEVASLLK
jgi:hypothetical protein